MSASTPATRTITHHLRTHRSLLRCQRADLASHLETCHRSRGRGFALHCLLQDLHAALSPRFMTTVLVIASIVMVLVV